MTTQTFIPAQKTINNNNTIKTVKEPSVFAEAHDELKIAAEQLLNTGIACVRVGAKVTTLSVTAVRCSVELVEMGIDMANEAMPQNKEELKSKLNSLWD